MSDEVNPQPAPTDETWEQKIAKAREAEKAKAAEAEVKVEVAETAAVVKELFETPKEEPKVEVPAEKKEEIPQVKQVMRPTGILFGKFDTAFEELEKKYNEFSSQQIREMIEQGDFGLTRFLALQQILSNITNQLEFMGRALEEIKKQTGSLSCLTPDNSDKRTVKNNKTGHLTGTNAKLATITALRGLKKVYLYNSGFHVVLRPLSVSELNAFFNSIDEETHEIGRELGGIFYAITDVFVKRTFMELFEQAVVSSNLVDWDKDKVLTNAISFHDYETLVWAMCSLLYRNKGVEMPMTCVSDKCQYRVENFNVDLNKLRFNRLDILKKEHIERVLSDEPMTSVQAQEYRASVPAFNAQYKYEKLVYTVQTPTIGKYLECGSEIINSICAHVHDSRSTRDKRIINELIIHVNKMLVPWITKMTACDDAGTEFWTDDRKVIVDTLEVDLHEETSLYEDFVKFIMGSKVTYICYAALKCPMCGAEPSTGNVDDFVVVDTQLLFFDHTCRKLVPTGLH